MFISSTYAIINIEFEAELMKRLEKHYGADYEVQIRDVTKLSQKPLRGLTVKRKDENLAPTIYLDYLAGMDIDEALNSAEAKWKLSPDTYFNLFEIQLTTALKLYYTDLTIEDAIYDIVAYLYDNYEDSGFIKELITNLFILNYDNKQI